MNGSSVVSIAFRMSPNDSFKHVPFEVWSGKSPRVEQNSPDVFGQDIPVPHPKMGKLMPAEKDSFEMKWRKQVINASQQLRHAGVIGIFRFKRELEPASSCDR